MQYESTSESSKDISVPAKIDDLTDLQNKLRRRSSVFKTDEIDVDVNRLFSNSSYSNNSKLINKESLKHQIFTWKNAYIQFKNEHEEIKNLYNNQTEKEEFDTFFNPVHFKNYKEKAEHFVVQVNNAVKMHAHLIEYYNLEINELSCFKVECSKKIQAKLL